MESLGAIWLIGWLCERALRSRVNPTGRGPSALLEETPNELNATRYCESCTDTVKRILPVICQLCYPRAGDEPLAVSAMRVRSEILLFGIKAEIQPNLKPIFLRLSAMIF